jgi:Protein of unknown function (DUF3352)
MAGASSFARGGPMSKPMGVKRLLRISLLAVLAIAASGCGTAKQAASTPEGADFAPGGTAVYVTGITDPASSQWQKADQLLGRFPGREKLLASARKDLAKDGLSWERDVKPALGDDLNLVLLSYKDADQNYVFFTKPKDEAKFTKLLEAGDAQDRQVHRKIDGWTVFADNEKALDNFTAARASGNSLSDEDAFKDAMNGLPDDAALRGYVASEPLYDLIRREAASDPDTEAFKNFSDSFGQLKYISFSSSAEADGVAVQAGYESTRSMEMGSYAAELDNTLPAGALVYLSFGDLEQYFNRALRTAGNESPEFGRQLRQIQEALGFSLKDDLLPLFSKEGAIAVYNASESAPDVLFALRVDDEDKATQLINRLAAIAELADVEVRPLSIRGAQGKVFAYPEDDVTIYAVVGQGKVLVSNTRGRIDAALGDGEKLSDDSVYEEALDASSAPDETSGFVYANLKLTIPAIFGLLDAVSESDSPEAIPPDVRANTKPLRSAILYTKQDGDRTTVSGFVTIK